MVQNPHDPNDPNYDPYDPNNPDALNIDDDTLRTGAPIISAAPSRLFFVLAVAGICIAGVLWAVFGNHKDDKDQTPTPTVITPSTNVNQPDVLPPVIPDPPQPTIDNAPQPPDTSALELSPIQGNEVDDKERQLRIRSDMLVVNNQKLFGGSATDADKDAQAARDAYASNDPNLTFANRAYASSQAVKAYAGTIGDLNNVIAQGKLIGGVLETAINTQLPGTLRAIVARDIYAEQGRNVLIPKGSRLIGVYNTNIFRGQDRVFIAWTRVIRPDGVDIYVNSPGVDSLGRAGLEGHLDQKFREIFTGALMTSIISIGTAYAASGLGNDDVSTTINTDGSATSTGDPVSFATINAVGQIGRVGRSVVEGLLDLRPTITVDQGTEINVFVNRDLHFPSGIANRTLIIE